MHLLPSQVLNRSLSECQNAQSDLTQNMKLSEVSRQVHQVEGRVSQHNAKVSR